MNTNKNILIAEFMGIADEIETGATSLIQIEGITGYYKNDNLKFHTDWNWLMEVVEKIETKKHYGKELQFSITKYSVSIQSLTNKEGVVIGNIFSKYGTYGGTEKIQAVYSACVEFIKWYNQATQDIENDKLIERSRKASE